MLWGSAMKMGCHFDPKPPPKPTRGWKLVAIPKADAVSKPWCLGSPFGAFQRTKGNKQEGKKPPRNLLKTIACWQSNAELV